MCNTFTNKIGVCFLFRNVEQWMTHCKGGWAERELAQTLKTTTPHEGAQPHKTQGSDVQQMPQGVEERPNRQI